MNTHINDGWLLFALGLLLIFALPNICFGADIYVDSVYGDDSNPGTQYAPVATWPRAIELGAATEGVGVVWAEGDTPTIETAQMIISGKDDRESVTKYRVLIPGHQSVNVQEKSRSEVARCQIVIDFEWIIRETPEGVQYETCVGKVQNVLAY